jgi:hypothetical protein
MAMARLLFLLFICFHAFAQDENLDPEIDSVPLEATDDVSGDTQESPDNSEDEAQDSTQLIVERTQPNPSIRRIDEVVTHLGLYNRSLEVIKFSDDEASISGLYLPENTGKPQGGILILHDIDQHAHWPNTIGPLREYLPDYGWNTLSLFFDDYIHTPLPKIPEPVKNTDADEASTQEVNTEEQAVSIENDSESPLDEPLDNPIDEETIDENFDSEGETGGEQLDTIAEDFQPFPVPTDEEPANEENTVDVAEQFIETMTQRVEGGLQQLNTLGQFNLVVVAHGLSANWAANTLKARFEQNPEAVGYALVIVDAKQSAYPEFPLNSTLSQFSIPILDLYTHQNEQDMRIATDRRNTIVREQKAKYMQIRLPSIKTFNREKQNMITRRVRGWLKTHAAGEEVNVVEKRY